MMAYNSYFPATYQPMFYQQPVYQQPVQQQSYQQPAQQTQTSMIWVSGEQEAQSYPVGPNAAVALWDSNGRTVYFKQADASGKPTIRVYDLTERAQSASGGVSAQDVKLPDYATKDELAALSASVEAFKGDLAKLRRAMKRKDEDDDE